MMIEFGGGAIAAPDSAEHGTTLAQLAPVRDKAAACRATTHEVAAATVRLNVDEDTSNPFKEPVAQPVEQLTFNQ